MKIVKTSQRIQWDAEELLELVQAEAAPPLDDGLEEDVEAASATSKKSGKLPRFDIVAYTGGPMYANTFGYTSDPIVIDLEGLRIKSRYVPIRMNHNSDQGIGHTTKITKETSRLLASGVVSRKTPYAVEFVESAGNKFPWKASIGAVMTEVAFLENGEKTNVNGRKVTGPAVIARQSEINEISVLDVPADNNTSVSVAAKGVDNEGESTMKKGKGTEGEQTTSTADAVVDDSKDTKVEGSGDSPSKTSEKSNKSNSRQEVVSISAEEMSAMLQEQRAEAAQQIRAEMKAEQDRISKITKICAGHSEIAEKAISEGWDAEHAELEVLRASRPTAPGVIVHESAITDGKVLEAAMVMSNASLLSSARTKKVEDSYDEQTLEAAQKRFGGRIGLQELILEAAIANGYRGRISSFKANLREIMRYAFNAAGGGQRIEAGSGWSNLDLTGILSNIANKFLLDGFYSVEMVWREICSIRNVSDFKTVTSYRMIGDDQYRLVGPGGEIEHGTLGEESYTNKADTYALMFAVTRTDMINDDLGAITAIPRKLGRGAGLKINDIFWTIFADHSSFFASGYSNLVTGNPVLNVAGLTTGEAVFMKLVDSDGKPIGHMPAKLLVPVDLGAIAERLYGSEQLRSSSADGGTEYPVNNPHQGKYTVHKSRYLHHASYGNSTTAWYLLANPEDLAMVEVAFLNGTESPTIESADADFNTLGVQMRGYVDFGVSLQDPKAAVKSTGAGS